ncbi:hypothetical protein [Roseovarius sp. ZX-A-9]|uniref:hypothetical protein n=1 Tax=Roseovarius sp. ZX-A-9 TaxID=3014783 RepID=UPI00232BE06F|nr:hypothetical protein [Roseovarius sp. ZX-A-9]
MNRLQLFSKPSWQHFLNIQGLHEIPLPALVAADRVWDLVRQTGVVQPTPSDYALWARSEPIGDPTTWLEHLRTAFSVILPSELPNLCDAMRLLPASSPAPKCAVTDNAKPAAPWDPCQYRADARVRKVSVHPWMLPPDWKEVLRRAAQGLPGESTAAPAHDILQRMREKLCQLTWSAQEEGLKPDLSAEVVDRYLTGLEDRLRLRRHGIRWSTMRATVEELHRFARYSGLGTEENRKYLSKRLTRYSFYERGQDALKFQALLETGNTTLGLMDKADALLLHAASEGNAARRHRIRNGGAILGLYSIVPLRNADAQLVLGESLFWESGTWVINTEISKTKRHNTDRLVVALEPEFARYVDVVIQGDHDARHLPELRACAMKAGGPLFVPESGKHPSRTYVPRLFKTYAGTSFTTTRTMLHTDQAINRGEVGTRDTMVMAHQTSPATAKKYQAKRVRQVAITRVQNAAAARRAALMPPDLLEAIQRLSNDEETEG